LRPFRLSELDFVRRFITLIDLAYESGSKVIISSDATINEAFAEIVENERQRLMKKQGGLKMRVQKGGGASSSMMSTYIGNTEWSATGLAEASLATGGAGETDVGFAIGRAVSRLHAMYGKMD
jgi:protein AFG1